MSTEQLAASSEATPSAPRPSPSQQRASDPATSVWVAANAGSGKTHVLVERLARLLLDGTPPSRILCLTFTNAAAAEMSNRLYERLSQWSMADNSVLRETLGRLTGSPPDGDLVAHARRLFPLALESPGGLKVHTIHAFCERLLHRFPLEAGVPPHFSVIDERGQAELVEAARDTVMRAAVTDPELGAAMARISVLVHDMSLDDLIGSMIARRHSIAALSANIAEFRDAVLSWLAAAFEIDAEENEQDVIADTFGDDAIDRPALARAAGILGTGTARDQALAPLIAALADAATPHARASAHISAFRTKGGKIRAESQLMTKRLAEAHPEAFELLLSERALAERFASRMAGTATLCATRAFLVVATAVVDVYDTSKAARSLLDYDDLIARTRSLLSRSEDAAWVLYKLDGGIDHILVDEAQDTSPDQWAIVQHLAEDMLAGHSARTAARTVFAVGDEKQSIFSFQGAEPRMFAAMRTFFSERSAAAHTPWNHETLTTSYRSTQTVLDAVDAIFADPDLRACLGEDAAPVRHTAHRDEAGRVELWNTARPDETAAADPWTAPLDYSGPSDPKVVLARRIAGTIAGWLREGRRLESQGRAILPGDIMILVRRRNAFVDAMVRELKSSGVPVAGVDRMRLGEQIVVQDLLALGQFVMLPEDDLSLACVLKSPLLDLDEDDLFGLAHGRAGSLWRALQEARGTSSRLAGVESRLSAWLNLADQVPPFEFFARVLCDGATRRRILGRLGPEANDPLNEFLNAALAFEGTHPPTLEGFLAWVIRGNGEIKRDMDHGQDEVRVMTVHGAKGLEANIVILPDTCSAPGGGRGPTLVDLPFPLDILPEPAAIPVWPQQGGRSLEPIAVSLNETRDRERAEHVRLLYVAMTRACDWLIVTGYEGTRGRAEGCWYDMVRTGLADDLNEVVTAKTGADSDQRWLFGSSGDANASTTMPAGAGSETAIPVADPRPGLPDWVHQPAPESVTRHAAGLTPSKAVAGDAPPPLRSPLAESRERRFSRGLAMHALLERLPMEPAADWARHAETLLQSWAPHLDPASRQAVALEAVAVLEDPAFAPFLADTARSEVAFNARIARPDGGTPVTVDGRVDRLVVGEGTVHVLDFKTHRPSPQRIDDVPSAHIAQMALYRAALSQIFGKPVRAALLWTDTARIMPLPDDRLDEALSRALRAWEDPAS